MTFTFVVTWRPLMAAVITPAAKGEVSRRSVETDTNV